MRFGLIGSGGHWQEYPRMLDETPHARVVAVAGADPGADLTAFDSASGVSADTTRYDDYREPLASARLDAVQVCVRPHRMAAVAADCLRAGVPAMLDKPIAMDEQQLQALWRTQRETDIFLAATHMYRRMPNFALARELVRAGRFGEVVAGHCQISFRWGASRPDWYRTRETFPGTFAFIGIHAVDTVYRLFGDCFRSVLGQQSTLPHPDYPAAASLSHATVTLDNGAVLALSADFLRPQGARSHGDIRLHLAGTAATLDATDQDEQALAWVDATADTTLAAPAIPYWYTTFAQHVLGRGAPFMTTAETFRITDLTLRIQRAIDSGESVDLRAAAPATGPSRASRR